MAIGGAVFAAGRYSVVWNSLALGLMEGDSGLPTLSRINHAEPINNTDAYGKSIIGAIHQGADWACQFTCIEYQAAVLATLWPFSALLGTLGTIGEEYTDRAQSLVLTAAAGTPAVISGPATITAPKAMLAPNVPMQYVLGPTLRKIPIKLQLFPTLVAGVPTCFTQT